MKNEYGMIKGESNADYHSNGAVGSSALKTFMANRYLYMRRHVTRDLLQEETKAMRLGSAAHGYILEQEVFSKNYSVLSADFNVRTNAGKAHIAELEQAGCVVIKHPEFLEIERLKQSIYSNPTAKILLSKGEAELSWRIKTPDFDMQSRTDWFSEATAGQAEELRRCNIDIKEGHPFIADLKTTADLTPWFRDNYSNSIYAFGYHLQNAFYRAVVNQIRKEQGKEIVRYFFFIVAEKKPPYDCAVIALSERSFGLAETQLKHHLAELGKCYQSGRWEGYKDRGVCVAGVPEHIANREEQDIFDSRTHKHEWLAGE